MPKLPQKPANDQVTAAQQPANNQTAPAQQPTNAQTAPTTQPANNQATSASDSTTPPADTSNATPNLVTSQPQQFLIGKRVGSGVQTFSMDVIEQALNDNPNINVLRKITAPGITGVLAAGADGPQSILVAQMAPEHADALQQNAKDALFVERDHPLTYSAPEAIDTTHMRDPGVVIPAGSGFTTIVKVVGPDNEPIVDADVFLYGSVWPAQGKTDANGMVQLTLFGDSPATLRALYVKPNADYWSFWLTNPAMAVGINTVPVIRISKTVKDFPDHEIVGWGQKAMRMDQLPEHYNGAGVKVAVVDSGAAITHRDLKDRISAGYDFTTKDGDSWQNDTVSHGTHCAGIITGAQNDYGIRGFAPEAQVYAFKIFPDGRFSDLIDALNHCIEYQIDVVNLSLGSDQTSDLLEQKIKEAREKGVACIVAAGNAGGPVQFPAALPDVLAVAAIGKLGEFPSSSYHAATMYTGANARVTSEGYFSAKFSCFGPQIGVCAPGVAIISSVPGDNYAAWDGTSMATPHVTGLAALILAHHPDFQGAYKNRDARRVDRLFQILKESAQPLDLGDPTRVGAGLPDAIKALGLKPAASAQIDANTAVPSDLQKIVSALMKMSTSQASAAGQRTTVKAAPAGSVVAPAGLLTPASAQPLPVASNTTSEAYGITQLYVAMQRAGLMVSTNTEKTAASTNVTGADTAVASNAASNRQSLAAATVAQSPGMSRQTNGTSISSDAQPQADSIPAAVAARTADDARSITALQSAMRRAALI